MRIVVLLIAGVFAVAPVTALQREGNTLTLTDEETAACEAGGGCIVAPKDAIHKAMEVIAERARLGCKDRT